MTLLTIDINFLRKNDYSNIKDYYTDIIDRVCLGQRREAVNLIDKLTKRQKQNCVKFYNLINHSGVMDKRWDEAKKLVEDSFLNIEEYIKTKKEME